MEKDKKKKVAGAAAAGVVAAGAAAVGAAVIRGSQQEEPVAEPLDIAEPEELMADGGELPDIVITGNATEPLEAEPVESMSEEITDVEPSLDEFDSEEVASEPEMPEATIAEASVAETIVREDEEEVFEADVESDVVSAEPGTVTEPVEEEPLFADDIDEEQGSGFDPLMAQKSEDEGLLGELANKAEEIMDNLMGNDEPEDYMSNADVTGF